MQKRDGRSKRERTRSQLLDAALRLYGTNGVSQTSLSDIALEASMASGTIYNYYDSKEKMIDAVRERLSEDIGARIFERADGVTDAASRVAIGCLAFLEETRKDSAWAKACLRMLIDRNRSPERFEREVLADLQAGLASNRFTVGPVDVAFVLVCGTIVAAMSAILRGHVGLSDDTVVYSILRGLGLNDRDAKRVVKTSRPG